MLINNSEYFQILEDIKTQIYEARYKASLDANRQQILLYLNIGKVILENNKYGSGFIENLSRDILSEFPDVKGYSVRNLRYMQKFYAILSGYGNLQTLSADLTWSHIKHLIDKTKNVDEYGWYAEETIKNGWSLTSLEYYVETKTYNRQQINA